MSAQLALVPDVEPDEDAAVIDDGDGGGGGGSPGMLERFIFLVLTRAALRGPSMCRAVLADMEVSALEVSEASDDPVFLYAVADFQVLAERLDLDDSPSEAEADEDAREVQLSD